MQPLCKSPRLAPSQPFSLHFVLTSFTVDKHGNRALIAVCVLNLFLYFIIYLFYKGVNKRRDRIWNSWTAKVSALHCEPVVAHALSLIAYRLYRNSTST